MALAITMGDASGIGPEVLLKAAASGQLDAALLVYGDLSILEKAQSLLKTNLDLHKLSSAEEPLKPGLNVMDAERLSADDFTPGELSKKAGAASYQYVVDATNDAIKGLNDGLVTLPVNKEAIHLTYPEFTGHTELVAELCGCKKFSMMYSTPKLAVTHVSTHVSLHEAADLVKEESVYDTIQLTQAALAKVIKNPRIAVAGLNPHAGEHGLFGSEDEEEIRPAVERARVEGIDVSGPFSADTLFHQAVNLGKYDAIVAMYHDQGFVPMKLIAFGEGVNVTIGLPIMRCSVDHGTAFDIAYCGKADWKNFVVAYHMGKKLAGLL